MSKRKGQTNGNAKPAGKDQSTAGATVDAAPVVAGADGVNGAPESEGLSDAQTAGSAATETVQQPENIGLGDAAAVSGGGEGSASAGGIEVAGGSHTGRAQPDDDRSGGSENDGDGSADGSSAAGHAGHGAQSGGDSHGDGNGSVPPGPRTGDDGDGSQGEARTDGSEVSQDLKAALELAGCETAENLIDMARIGFNVMEAIDDIRKLDGPFKDWAPMDDPAEIVHDLFNALEYARERAGATPASDPDGSQASNEAPPEVDRCPICDVPFKPDDICATDVTEGTCHAECLAGTPVVDLETGKPHDGPICTFLYSDDVPGMPAATIGAEMAIMDNLAGSAMLSAEFAWDGAWDAFFTHTRPETCADGQPEFPLSPIMGRDLAEYVRKIGRRATPEILVQQLVILKHRQSADLGEQERIAMRTFIATLLDLDDFAAAEKKRLEDLAAEKPEPRPVPIEDTTMETVNDTLETW
jgi:hypothetical protein